MPHSTQKQTITRNLPSRLTKRRNHNILRNIFRPIRTNIYKTKLRMHIMAGNSITHTEKRKKTHSNMIRKRYYLPPLVCFTATGESCLTLHQLTIREIVRFLREHSITKPKELKERFVLNTLLQLEQRGKLSSCIGRSDTQIKLLSIRTSELCKHS